jgi:membrane protease YdiL (CAAX protease family)
MLRMLDPGNHLFVLARLGHRSPSIPGAIGVVPVMLVLLIASQVAMRSLFRALIGNGAAADLSAELVGFLSIFGGLWCVLYFWAQRPFWSLGFERGRSGRRVIRGALIAAVMVAATVALVLIPGATVGRGEIQTRGLAALGGGLLSFVATSVQSSAEEALFRGWLLQALGARYGAVVGIAGSSLIFTLAHATTGPPPLGWVNLFFFGTTAALIALAEGGLWGACAWHAVWNWTGGSLLGFTVDRSVHPGLLASIQTSGPDYITGGSFGPEGGIAATTILLGGIAILVILLRGRRNRQ